MEILGNMGVDISLLVAQIINFGLLVWLLNKFMYKPILARIEKDEKILQQAQTQQKELEKQTAEITKKEKNEIVQLKKKARKIIREAEGIAKDIKKQAKQDAQKEKNAVIQQIHDRLTHIENEERKK